MKSIIAKCLMTLITLVATHAIADISDSIVPAIRWSENSQTVSVTAEVINKSTVPPLGYVLDLITKKDICYVGKDFEAIDLLFAGLNRHGIEICDSYIVVLAGGTIAVGPCQQPHIHDELYNAMIPACAK